ncbi:MAG: hypothetical protein EXR67_06910 [Dehalococcoidia bacterium]|nr:hypothetical protein [Dehalococcoidia bacterium]
MWQGVIFWTDNLAEMVRFYEHSLGLAVHSRHEDFVAFQVRPELRISVGLHGGVHGKSRDPHRVMVNPQVADAHAAYEELTKCGVRFVRAPEREDWGEMVTTLQDPDGNLL